MKNGFQQRKICGTMHSLKQFKLFACCRNWPRPRFLLVEGQKLGFKKQFAKSFISVVFLFQCFLISIIHCLRSLKLFTWTIVSEINKTLSGHCLSTEIFLNEGFTQRFCFLTDNCNCLNWPCVLRIIGLQTNKTNYLSSCSIVYLNDPRKRI